VMGSPGKLGEPPVSTGQAGTDHTGSTRSKVTNPLSVRGRQESESEPEEPNAEPRAKAGWGRGSLSILIVAFESRETIPREPVISEGRYRGCGLVAGPTP
jgi:hypothetical protein